jgi:hypothetical protein
MSSVNFSICYLSAAASMEKLLKIGVVYVVEQRLGKFGQNWPGKNYRYTKTEGEAFGKSLP